MSGFDRRHNEMTTKLKSILNDKGLIDEETKKLTYSICDWVIKCSGEECMDGNVYTSQGYGFLCLPRKAYAK